MASPLDIINKKDETDIYLPQTINIAINLIQAFISNNNPLGLRLAIIFSGLKEQLKYKGNAVVFDVSELCLLCNIDRDYLSSNLRKMKQTIYTYVDLDGSVGETVPFHSHKYSFDKKSIEIEVSSKAKELFTILKKKEINGYQFVPALSKNLLSFNLKDMNKHTLKMQMLLEMINNYTTNKKKKLSIDELNGYFGTKYSRWIELDRKILKLVEKDIKTYSSVAFSYKPYVETSKNGRPKYGGIEISILDNTNLFNIEQQAESTTSSKKQKSIKEDILEYIDIDIMTASMSGATKQDHMQYLQERLNEFIEWVEESDKALINKLKKDWNKSFERHLSGYEKNLNKLDKRI